MNTVLSAILSGGLTGCTVVFLLRSWITERLQQSIQHEYQTKLETHKNDLQKETSREIEELRTHMQILARQTEITFAALHAKRAKIIAGLFERLVRAVRHMEHCAVAYEINVRCEVPAEQQRDIAAAKNVVESLRDLDEFFHIHEIYFDQSLCDQLSKLLSSLTHATCQHLSIGQHVQLTLEEQAEFLKTYNDVKEDIPTIEKQIRQAFRQILAVTTE